MSNIRLNVTDQCICAVEMPAIYSGDVNYDTVTFTFSSDWNNYIKTAVFYRTKDEAYYQVLDNNNTCTIPKEVLKDKGTIFISVFGVLDNKTITSQVISYRIQEGAITEDLITPDPTPDVFEQALARCAEAINIADGATAAIANKVDKVSGKGLSTTDVTAAMVNTWNGKLDATATATNSSKLGGKTESQLSVASAASATNATNATNAGNADTLDGKHASDFLSITGGTLTGSLIQKKNSYPLWLEGNNANGKRRAIIFTNCPNGEVGSLIVRTYSDEEGSTFKNFTFATDGRFYAGGNPVYDTANKPTAADVGALSTSGGSLSGDLKATSLFAYKDTDGITDIDLKNSKRRILNRIFSDGSYSLKDVSNSKDIITSTVNGTTTFNGTASGNLPLTGGTVKSSGATPLTIRREVSMPANVSIRYENDTDGGLGFIGVSKDKQPIFEQVVNSAGTGAKIMHHDGNSAKTIIASSAPSDTSALWIDIS